MRKRRNTSEIRCFAYGPALRSTEFGSYSAHTVRVRITKPSVGIVDGRSLSGLIPGLSYDLPRSLAEYLIATRMADEVHGETPAARASIDDDALIDHINRGVRIAPAQAADKKSTPRKKRRQRSSP